MEMKKLGIPLILLVLLATSVGTALASGTVYYTGQGFTFDGTTWIINDERCGVGTQTPANDGSTGQFANWNGLGQPYETGQAYLVWVLTVNGASAATLYLPTGPVSMIKVGGTYKYASQYWSPDELIGVVYATWTGGPNRANLTVSHGCAGFEESAWCSPGYWKNTLNKTPTNGWMTIGVDPATAVFNSYVSPNYYANDLVPNQLLTYVLNHPSDFGGTLGTAGPYNLTAFNAVGAYLTDQIPGYQFDPSLVGNDDACPIDAYGVFK
jgi:hypothetical protein